MITVEMIDNLMSNFAPKSLSEEWDNDGVMLCKDLQQQVDMVVVSLDVTESAVDFCIDNGAKVLITHHPYIFKPLSCIVDQDYRVMSKLMKNNISVLSYHTRLDSTDGGVNDTLAQKLELKEVTKLNSMYSQMVRMGKLCEIMTPKAFGEYLLNILDCKNIRASLSDKKIQKVAMVGGSGKDFITDAYLSGADAFVTAEVPHHVFYKAKQLGISVYDCGHYYTENVIVEKIIKILKENFNQLECKYFDVKSPYVSIN